MIWVILYFICATICCGIILYVSKVDYDDPIMVLVTFGSLFWPVFLLMSMLYGLGHCVRFLITKIIKTIKEEERK